MAALSRRLKNHFVKRDNKYYISEEVKREIRNFFGIKSKDDFRSDYMPSWKEINQLIEWGKNQGYSEKEILELVENTYDFSARVLAENILNSSNASIKTTQEKTIKKSKSKDLVLPIILGVSGSFILILGVFAPLVNVPIIGSINYFLNGRGDGVFILIDGILALITVLTKKFIILWFFIIIGTLLLVYLFYKLHQIENIFEENTFRLVFQIQWGLPLMLIGMGLLISSAIIGVKIKN